MNYYSLISSMSKTPAVDADALAFITNAVITNTTQQNAINTLVTDLKSASIWTKMKAIYPFVGGTAAQHRFNLKDPRTLDAAYYLTFWNGWTHSATGALPSGTDGFADTKLNATLVNTTNHLSYYSRTSSFTGIQVEIGYYDATALQTNQLSSAYRYISGSFGSATNFTTTSNSSGFWLGSKRSNSDREAYRNSTSEATQTLLDPTNVPNKILLLGARGENAGPAYFSSKECAFASIGDGLTDTEEANFYTAVQKFNTTLGRQV